MCEVETKLDGETARVTLKGVIDEQTSLEKLIGRKMKTLHVYSRGVTRINSPGVKDWRTFFERARGDGIQIKFWETAPPLVDQMNFFPDFIKLTEVESICTPHFCETCSHVTLKNFSLSELILVKNALPIIPCEKCKGPTEFDELDANYFAFLND